MSIKLFGVFGRDITVSMVEEQLSEQDYYLGNDLDIEFDSVGGDVFEGYKIGALLRSLPNKTIAKIKGDCASIATYVACSCDTILLNKNNNSDYLFMIHNPLVGNFQGNVNDMKRVSKELDRIKKEILVAYTHKSNLEEGQLSQMMNNETLLTKDEALSSGFIDGLYEDDEIEKKENVEVINYINIANMDKPEQTGENLLTKMLAKLNAFEAKFDKKFTNYLDTTTSGQQIFIDAESVEEAEGAAVFVAEGGESTGEKMPDGTYQLESNVEITVAGGSISAITEIDVEAKKKDEEMEDLKNQLAAKTEELENLQNSIAEFENRYTALEEKLDEAMKKTVVAEVKPEPKPSEVVNAQKARISGSFIDNIIEKNKKQLKIK